MSSLDWPSILNGLAQGANPLMTNRDIVGGNHPAGGRCLAQWSQASSLSD
jgi:hypothetical protein